MRRFVWAALALSAALTLSGCTLIDRYAGSGGAATGAGEAGGRLGREDTAASEDSARGGGRSPSADSREEGGAKQEGSGQASDSGGLFSEDIQPIHVELKYLIDEIYMGGYSWEDAAAATFVSTNRFQFSETGFPRLEAVLENENRTLAKDLDSRLEELFDDAQTRGAASGSFTPNSYDRSIEILRSDSRVFSYRIHEYTFIPETQEAPVTIYTHNIDPETGREIDLKNLIRDREKFADAMLWALDGKYVAGPLSAGKELTYNRTSAKEQLLSLLSERLDAPKAEGSDLSISIDERGLNLECTGERRIFADSSEDSGDLPYGFSLILPYKELADVLDESLLSFYSLLPASYFTEIQEGIPYPVHVEGETAELTVKKQYRMENDFAFETETVIIDFGGMPIEKTMDYPLIRILMSRTGGSEYLYLESGDESGNETLIYALTKKGPQLVKTHPHITLEAPLSTDPFYLGEHTQLFGTNSLQKRYRLGDDGDYLSYGDEYSTFYYPGIIYNKEAMEVLELADETDETGSAVTLAPLTKLTKYRTKDDFVDFLTEDGRIIRMFENQIRQGEYGGTENFYGIHYAG